LSHVKISRISSAYVKYALNLEAVVLNRGALIKRCGCHQFSDLIFSYRFPSLIAGIMFLNMQLQTPKPTFQAQIRLI
jgi:hypothetical protein